EHSLSAPLAIQVHQYVSTCSWMQLALLPHLHIAAAPVAPHPSSTRRRQRTDGHQEDWRRTGQVSHAVWTRLPRTVVVEVGQSREEFADTQPSLQLSRRLLRGFLAPPVLALRQLEVYLDQSEAARDSQACQQPHYY